MFMKKKSNNYSTLKKSEKNPKKDWGVLETVAIQISTDNEVKPLRFRSMIIHNAN